MTDHDPLCPKRGLHPADEAMMAVVVQCRCDLIARVRADERARAYPGREVRSQLIGAYAQLSHAEAVAAKLVEVICDDAAVLAWDLKALEATARERDAARAEVAALDEMNVKMAEHVARHHAEVVALTRWKDEATEVIKEWERIHTLLGKPGFIGESKAVVTYDEVRDLLEDRAAARHRQIAVPWQHILDASAVANAARREVLADLRAKVQGLGLCVEPDDGEPACFCDDVTLRAASVTLDHVLALIEGADRG